MTQFNMNEYLEDEEKIKLNIVTEKKNIVENIENIDKQINESNKFVEVTYGNDIYITWKVKYIRPLITKFLKEKYSDSIIVPEINLIDITIFNTKLDEIIPIEIQKAPTSNKNGVNKFANSSFENAIRKQLDDNITNYGKCWFFFDFEYFRYLQSKNVGSKTSINMTWIIDLIKDCTLKVFIIRYDGIIKELTTKDFDFLKEISHTCIIGYNNDERELNRNKLKIFRNILFGYKFTQNEINDFYNELYNNIEENNQCHSYFRKNKNERCKLYGNIIFSIGNLNLINNTLDMSINEYDPHQHNKLIVIYMGIFEILKNHNMKFIDKFDICKYFPGYLRREKHWLTYKGNEINGKTFLNMCNGYYKNSSTIFDY